MTFYDQTIAIYRSRIDTLLGLLSKAEAHEKGDALLEARLAPDMLPLATQVLFIANFPGEAVGRLTDRSFTPREESETTLAAAKASLKETAKLLDEVDASELCSTDTPVVLDLPNGMQFTMTTEQYVRDWSLPNFYFHLTTAYAILRSEGLEIGKADFLPFMMPYITKGPSQN